MSVICSIGKIIKGTFQDHYIGKVNINTWAIIPAERLEQALFSGGWKYNDPKNGKGKYTEPRKNEIVSEKTVDHFEEIGSQQKGPDGMAIISGMLTGGLALGLAAGAASATTMSDVAFYMKNGDSFIVHFTNGDGWQELKSSLYVLPQQPIAQTTAQRMVCPNCGAVYAMTSFPSKCNDCNTPSYSFMKKMVPIPSDEDIKFDIVLLGVGDNRFNVVKELRDIFSFGMAETKTIIEDLPMTLKEDVPKNDAERIQSRLESVSASVKLKKKKIQGYYV